ncbi:MAG TPA: HAD-IA family hydrolase [Acidimicrobiales bacterium]
MYDALLLDIGFVIIDVRAAVAAYEKPTGTGPPGREPVDQDGDARWRAYRAGVISADEYWGEVARSRGFDGLRGLFRALTEAVPDDLFDPAAVALMRDAREARRRVGVLSNEAYTFIGRDFFARRPEFADLDAFVDASEVGARKPAPEAYLAAADALAVMPAGVVFLDDTPECVEGANHVGMHGILVDPFDRTPAFDRARSLLGLPA